MSVESISKVLNADIDVTHAQMLVLIGIANHDGDGGAWPSMETLARYAKITLRSARRAVADLEKKGLIVRHVQEGGTARTPNHARPNMYELRLPPDAGDRGAPDRGDRGPRTEGTSEPSLEPSTEPSTPQSPPTGEVEVVPEWEQFFNAFWEAYPRKIGKPAAKRAMKAKYDPIVRTVIADGTKQWIYHWARSGTQIQFVPHPSTFLNQERYNDEPPPEPVTANKMSKAEEAIAKIRNRDQ